MTDICCSSFRALLLLSSGFFLWQMTQHSAQNHFTGASACSFVIKAFGRKLCEKLRRLFYASLLPRLVASKQHQGPVRKWQMGKTVGGCPGVFALPFDPLGSATTACRILPPKYSHVRLDAVLPRTPQRGNCCWCKSATA